MRVMLQNLFSKTVAVLPVVKLVTNRVSTLSVAKYTVASYETKISDCKPANERQTFHPPFARAKLGPFFQAKPELGNQYDADGTLKSYLQRTMPQRVLSSIEPDLHQFGGRVASDIYDLSIECERNPPRLIQYDAYANRIDDIVTCDAWKQMKAISAKEGLIASAYERDYGEWSRLYQVAKLYLFAPSSGLYSCPLAMTDGAAKIIELLQNKNLSHAYSHLTTRNPLEFWTSGQWMTERKGGSDVAGGTETVAVPQSDGSYKLYGYKWFSSATDSDMTMTLARIVDEQGQVIQGTKGLSMFYLEVRDLAGNLNNIEVVRLKDKLGTRQLPTAELLLDGTKAMKISEDGRGVAGISTMLILSRLHNALSSAAGMKRITHLARDFAAKRTAFGRVIKDHRLHIKTLANMEVESRAALLLVLEVAKLLGQDDVGKISEQDSLLFRLLTPITKLYTAKQAVAVASEGLECFGGLGYLEDTGLPAILRDAQVLPIWEGTTNILSLDVLRALGKTDGKALLAFHRSVEEKTLPALSHTELQSSAEKLRKASQVIITFASQHTNKLETAARDFAYSLARTYMGALMVEHACWTEASTTDVLAAKRWCEKPLTPMMDSHLEGNFNKDVTDLEYQLVMEGIDSSH